MKSKIVNHKCPHCGYGKAELIDTCVLYNKYYICVGCRYTDFIFSRKLTKEENDARIVALRNDGVIDFRVKVAFT